MVSPLEDVKVVINAFFCIFLAGLAVKLYNRVEPFRIQLEPLFSKEYSQ